MKMFYDFLKVGFIIKKFSIKPTILFNRRMVKADGHRTIT